MKINKKLIITFSIILGLSWLGNGLYYISRKIEGPIFSYTYMNNYEQINISYLMNQYDKDKVSKIILPELNNAEFGVHEKFGMQNVFVDTNNQKEDIFKDGSAHYRLTNFTLNLESGYYPSGEEYKAEDIYKNEVNITRIKYVMKSGKNGECDIGKINFKPNIEEGDKGYRLFEYSGTISYAENITAETLIVAKDKLEIIGLTESLNHEILKDFIITINGREISDESFPISVNEGEEVVIKVVGYYIPFYFNSNIDVSVILRDPEGSEDRASIFTYLIDGYTNTVTTKDVDELLKMRGVK